MIQPYQNWKFLYPPRPESAVNPSLLGYYEGRGWVAQAKKNGTNTLIGLSPDGEIITRTRHDTPHKQWNMGKEMADSLQRIFPNDGTWYVLCAELCHSKTKTLKDTVYIHDVLVWHGEFLVGSTFAYRQALLEPYRTNVEGWSHYVLDSHNKIWLAKNFDKGFKILFDSIKDPSVDEGLVLKDPKGKLNPCTKPTDNAHWSVKCRHPTKNYQW